MKVYEFSKMIGKKPNDIKLVLNELGMPVSASVSKLSDDQLVVLKDHFKVEDPKPKATKPWNADNNPWSLDLLRLKKKRQGFVPRWTTKDLLERKLDQGWTVADRKDYGGTTDKLPGEEGKMDSTILRRELILIEMPDELAGQRKAFFENKTKTRSVDAKQIAASAAKKITDATGEDVGLNIKHTQSQGK